jgi:ribosome-associated protein
VTTIPKAKSKARAKKPPAPSPAPSLLQRIQTALEDGKAEDIVVIDLRGKTSFADYLVIASGRSQRQVAALAERLTATLKQKHRPRLPTEGLPQGDWVLIDAGDVIVHLFRPDVRRFYNLEKMWGADLSDAENAPA